MTEGSIVQDWTPSWSLAKDQRSPKEVGSSDQIPIETGIEVLQQLETTWVKRLAGSPTRVMLTDGEDPRVVLAAIELADAGLIEPVLLGRPAVVLRLCRDAGRKRPEAMEVLAPGRAAGVEEIQAGFELSRGASALSKDAFRSQRLDPLYLGARAVRGGYVQACVGGSTRSSGDVVRAALDTLSARHDSEWVTSCFLMILKDGRIMAFGDCAVLPDPTSVQLAEVAIGTSRTFVTLTSMVPIVALLSFSTKGSSIHSRALSVVEATRIARQRAPQLCIDGELQIDAALDPDVGMTKAPGSVVAGHANVMIFPNLDAGNIAYKLAQRLCGARALGPFLQGVNGSMSDLSRGCSTSDVRITATACAVLSQRTSDED